MADIEKEPQDPHFASPTLNGATTSERSGTPPRANGASSPHADGVHRHPTFPSLAVAIGENEPGLQRFLRRFKGEGRKVPTWSQSVKAFVNSSVLNVLIIFLPISWVAHYLKWTEGLTFSLCMLAIVSLESMTDYVAENLALYLGKSLGDLTVISLDNLVEATLAIILLKRCDLRLMQSTVIGVILLHLLLVPGVSFISGGRDILHQHLDPHTTELNKSLLTLGVLTLVVPAAFFAGIRNNVASSGSSEIVQNLAASVSVPSPISDETRGELLKLSRGLAVILLIGYIGSRIYLHNPPGQGNALSVPAGAPTALKEKEAELEEEQPQMNQWSCFVAFAITIPLLAITAEWLVDSLEKVRETSGIKEEWFGLILLPLVSFGGEALVTILYWTRKSLFANSAARLPEELADGRTIDLSIQFSMFWAPLLVLIAWWTNKPLFMLFDFFEVAVAIGACFLVNSVTDDAKTNWAEGLILLSFYMMIATSAWFYDGQQDVATMLACESVAAALSGGAA
ncbi:hypothetical protein DL93DRAFT_2052113 [Clavulina sp. PMI_390]|nr:hypothetical protein DL93DRAFT_2052113 [Clavulina sp. PMI_390]